MKLALIAPFVLSFSLLGTSASARNADAWFGSDKALHFGVSLVLAAGGYAGSSPWLEPRSERALVGGAFSLTLGAGKEVWDLTGHGDPSWRDFTWDVLGAAVGVALALSVDTLATPKHDARIGTSAQGLVFRF